MRFDTMNAASYLVWRLQHAGIVRDMRDDGDLIYLELKSRDRLMIYLIEREMTLTDVQHHLKTNTKRGLHTLFLFWIDMLLPRDGTLYFPDDWMQAVLSLHNDKIYGFEVAGREAYFVPVHFEGGGYQKQIRYGGIVDYGKLNGRMVATNGAHLKGRWRVADFESHAQQRTYSQDKHPLSQRAPDAVQHFKTLGIAVTEDKASVKLAYRKLARRYHPDVNQTPDAMRRMKAINHAYTTIMRLLEGE
jgi:hypothetical protein